MTLQGIFASLTTPFDHKGDLYLSKIQHNAGKWNRTKLAGYAVCGSTGEGVMLTCEEKVRVWEAVRASAAPEKLLIAGASAESVRETVQLANLAAGLGYSAALVRPPRFYGNLMREGTAQAGYYRAVADQARIPILIQASAPEAVEIPFSTVLELAAHPNVIGVVSSGDAAKTIGMLGQCPELQVLAGSASELWPALAAGVAGAILAFAGAAPYTCLSILEAARAREDQAGLDLQARVAPAAAAVDRHGVPGLKYAMDLNGYYGGPSRLPLLPPGPEARREIEEAFRDVKG